MKKSILPMLVLALALAACSKTGVHRYTDAPAPMSEGLAAKAGASNGGAGQAMRRYLALRHRVTLQLPGAALAQHFAAIQAECIKLGCEILSAGQEAESGRQLAGATLIARVPPAAFPQFFSGIQTHGTLLSHYSDSEDKTAEVIDVEARIKNLEALRNRILELLAKKAGTLKEMLEAEKQLADTQAALDSINGQRRALANQTDMVRIEITLQAQSIRNEGHWAAPVAIAASEAGSVLMTSVAVLMTAAVAVLPWAVALGVLWIGLRRIWRRKKARAKAPASAGPSHQP
jgi:hypothetical protein